jgi:hypothetical protein
MIDIQSVVAHLKQWAESRSPFAVIGEGAEIDGGIAAHCRFAVKGHEDVDGLKFAMQSPADAAVADVNQQVYDAAWAAVKADVPPRWIYDFSSPAAAVESIVDLETKLGWKTRGVLFVSHAWLLDHGLDDAGIREVVRRLDLRATGQELTLAVSQALNGCPLVVKASGFSFTAETGVTTSFGIIQVAVRYVARIADGAVLPVTACTLSQLAEGKAAGVVLTSRLGDLTAALDALNATVAALLSKDPLHQFPAESPAGSALRSTFAAVEVVTAAIAEEVRRG